MANYSEDFKFKAVRYYRDNDCSMREAAKRFQITVGTMSKWHKQFSTELTPSASGSFTVQEELESLRSQISTLRSEVTVLRGIIQKKFLTEFDIPSQTNSVLGE